MSRSYRSLPIFGIASADSEKEDKRLANRRFRRITRQYVKQHPDADIFPLVREMSNVWSFNKDGKRYRYIVDPKDMRK